MFCYKCGKQLENGSVFCNICGTRQPVTTVQPPVAAMSAPSAEPAVSAEPVVPKEAHPEVSKAVPGKKKTPKWLIPAVALAVAVAVALVFLLPMLTQEASVTVYLLSSRKEYVDGELAEETYVEYDDRGCPVLINYSGSRAMRCDVSYDGYGNRIREVFSQEMVATQENGETTSRMMETVNAVEYEYNKAGKPEKATVYHGNTETPAYTCAFSYDSRGNLVLVEYDYDGEPLGIYWAHFAYDRQGRLVQETFCRAFPAPVNPQVTLTQSSLSRFAYSYNADGSNVQVTVSYGGEIRETPVTVLEMDAINYGNGEKLDYSFTRGGVPAVLRDNFTLDEKGDPQKDGWTFDDHGNLIRSESRVTRKVRGEFVESETVVEYTYQEMVLPKSEAMKAQKMMRQSGMPGSIKAYIMIMGLVPLEGAAAPLATHSGSGLDDFYYYMIPNPVY